MLNLNAFDCAGVVSIMIINIAPFPPPSTGVGTNKVHVLSLLERSNWS